MEAATGDWTGIAIVALNRGRIDIIEGGLPGFFSKGDYILFDGSDAIAVRPEEKSFMRLFPGDQDSISPLTNPTSVKTTVSNSKVTIDSLLLPETIEGRRTSHYRVRSTYVVTIDVSNVAGLETIAPRSTEIEQTTDYYYADLPEFPQVALSGAPYSPPQLRAPSYVRDLTVQLSATISKLPKDKMSLRTVATTRMESGDMSSLRETTTEIIQMRSHDADTAKLLLPSDYRQVPVPGAKERAGFPGPGADAGEKWRRPPQTP
jgi:hypothetical protein